MNHSDNNVKKVVDCVLDGQATSIRFEATWNKAIRSDGKPVGIRRTLVIPMIAVICCLALFSVGFAGYTAMQNIDRTDYPFADDSRLTGKWASVDFVEKIENFKPDKKYWKEDLYLKSLVFIKDGKMLAGLGNEILARTTFSWTKDIILNKHENTASKYTIKDIAGTTYMFFEWKSGDYVFRNLKPFYYVLKKVNSDDYANYQVRAVAEDKVDYPFADDPQMKGKWESVDLVDSITDFNPAEKSWQWGLDILGFDFKDNGAMEVTTAEPEASKRFAPVWTKGMVLFKETKLACKCEIKEMDGATYLFFEWKNGDYLYRGVAPSTLVLKKVE